jgi:hypothetical protein
VLVVVEMAKFIFSVFGKKHSSDYFDARDYIERLEKKDKMYAIDLGSVTAVIEVTATTRSKTKDLQWLQQLIKQQTI